MKGPRKKRAGFTLIEVVLVLVLLVILSGISLPYFAGTFRGSQLRSAARTIDRMAKYARGMAIMREKTLTLALDHETMQAFVGMPFQSSTNNAADGELDQDVLTRLGYVDGGPGETADLNIDKEVQRNLSDRLEVVEFDKEWTVEDRAVEDQYYMVRFFPNGQCEWFVLELRDSRDAGIILEIDPVSGKVRSEFTQ